MPAEQNQDFERYNQGFGKFGPMEHCNQGEWTRFKHAAKVIKANRDHHDLVVADMQATIKRMSATIDRQNEELLKSEDQITDLTKEISIFKERGDTEVRRGELLTQELGKVRVVRDEYEKDLVEAKRINDQYIAEVELLRDKKDHAWRVANQRSSMIFGLTIVCAVLFVSTIYTGTSLVICNSQHQTQSY